MYNYIKNPKNGKNININTKLGKSIVNRYIYKLQKGGSLNFWWLCNFPIVSSFNIIHNDPISFNSEIFLKWLYFKIGKGYMLLKTPNNIEDIKKEYKNFNDVIDITDSALLDDYKLIISFLIDFINILEDQYAENMSKLYTDLTLYFQDNKNKKFNNLLDFIAYIDKFIYHTNKFKFILNDVLESIEPFEISNKKTIEILNKRIDQMSKNQDKLDSNLSLIGGTKLYITTIKWIENFNTDYQQIYWTNSVTNQIIWSKPKSVNEITYSINDPAKWIEYFDSNYNRPYWVHSDTRQSTWTKPDSSGDFFYLLNFCYNYSNDIKFYIKIIFGKEFPFKCPLVIITLNNSDCIRLKFNWFPSFDFISLGNYIKLLIEKSFVYDNTFIYSLLLKNNLEGIETKTDLIKNEELYYEGCESFETQNIIKKKWISNGLEFQSWSKLYKEKPIFIIVAHGKNTVGVKYVDASRRFNTDSFKIPKNTQVISFNRSGSQVDGSGTYTAIDRVWSIFLSALNPSKYENHFFQEDGITRKKIYKPVTWRYGIFSNCQKLYRYGDIYNDGIIDFDDYNNSFVGKKMGIYIFNSFNKFTKEFLEKTSFKIGDNDPAITEYVKKHSDNDFIYLEYKDPRMMKMFGQIIEQLGEGTYYNLACRGIQHEDSVRRKRLGKLAREKSQQRLNIDDYIE